MIEQTPVEYVALEPPVEPIAEPPAAPVLDYGAAMMRAHDDGSTSVDHADRVIGVHVELLDELQRSGALSGGSLQLDTAGHFVFEHRGPSSATDGVTLFERVPVVVAVDEP